MRRSLHDFLAAHIGQLVDAFAEFGAVHILRDQIGNIGLDAFFQLRLLFIGYRDQPHGLLRGNGGHWIRRCQLQFADGLGNGFSRHGHFPLSIRYATDGTSA